MAKLRHIAISVPDPWAAAEFFVQAFGLEKVGETDSSLARGVYLSDGVMNIALLNYKSDEAAGADRGKDFVGLHHIGFWVDDVDAATQAVEAAGATWLMGEPKNLGNSFYEIKYRDPLGMIFDITANGWGGASKDGTATTGGPKLRRKNLVARRSGSD